MMSTMTEENYLHVNKDLWNNRVKGHYSSDFYDIKKFKKTRNSLNSIELDLLGDLTGKNILHLQCHFGMDTLSMANMGAKAVGLDFSQKAVDQAGRLRDEMALEAEFICCNVTDAAKNINAKFDIVFTSYGTIGWIPELFPWAEQISKLLKPEGQFIIADFHPMVWIFDENFSKISYSYFNKKSIIENASKSYASVKENGKSITWNHSLSEIFSALREYNLKLDEFKEFEYSPYPCFSNMIELENGKFLQKNIKGMIPMVYAMKWHL